MYTDKIVVFDLDETLGHFVELGIFTDSLKQIIVNDVSQIVNSDPRTQVIQSIVTSLDNAIQIEVTLLYLPYNIQETLQFKFDQANGIR